MHQGTFGELPGPIECSAQPVEHINALGGSRLAQKLTVLKTIPRDSPSTGQAARARARDFSFSIKVPHKWVCQMIHNH
jgi:hypothetical protein